MTLLTKKNACEEGADWADSQPDYKVAWDTCERADWLLWAAQNFDVDLKKLTLAKVACARTVQHLMTDQRSIDALDIAEKFGRGEASRKKLNTAADAAYAAAHAFATYAPAAAANADAAATAAVYAATADDAAKKQALKKMTYLVREHIKFEDLKIGA